MYYIDNEFDGMPAKVAREMSALYGPLAPYTRMRVAKQPEALCGPAMVAYMTLAAQPEVDFKTVGAYIPDYARIELWLLTCMEAGFLVPCPAMEAHERYC